VILVEVKISISDPATIATAVEYGELASKKQPSESDLDRMEEILTLAIHDGILNFWIDEIDHCLGHRLGLLEAEDQAHYENQQSVLREYLEALLASYPDQKISAEHLQLLPKGQRHSSNPKSSKGRKYKPSCQASSNCH
jgi:N-acyl-D-aspartate/D-glutamate deacylase